MKPEDQAWQKLVAAARNVRDERDTAAPYGFATRVAALAMATGRPPTGAALIDRLAWRALGVAALLAVISVASNYSSLMASPDEDLLLDDFTATALLEVSPP